MRNILIVLSSCLLLAGCGAKRAVVSHEPVTPPWHTCLIQSARAKVAMDGTKISATVTMQTVYDSMLVISVMPLFGIEMMRLEATPLELIAIDKMHGQYAKASFADLNRKLTPSLNWDVLQQICAAELPTGNKTARLLYSFGEKTIELTIEYPERKTDVPVKVYNLPLNKYAQVDVSKFL
ncbi:MAG: DUF4292 domain-containing protein [Paludibacteraceae bacterium]|nr:DUF4292 domain-containing protein [Paludibacteraceae bacterium]